MPKKEFTIRVRTQKIEEWTVLAENEEFAQDPMNDEVDILNERDVDLESYEVLEVTGEY